jgi:hypothetical protein
MHGRRVLGIEIVTAWLVLGLATAACYAAERLTPGTGGIATGGILVEYIGNPDDTANANPRPPRRHAAWIAAVVNPELGMANAVVLLERLDYVFPALPEDPFQPLDSWMHESWMIDIVDRNRTADQPRPPAAESD